MNLAKFSRRRYTYYDTPIEYLANLTKVMGGPNIYMKRDDLLGLTGGGNKTRKLEFLMAEALEQAGQAAAPDLPRPHQSTVAGREVPTFRQ